MIFGIHLCSAQVRIKDVSKVQGLHDTQLIGYGLVVGLDGTGDGTRTMFTVQSILNMLKNIGIEVSTSRIRVKNVAAVMITSTIKPFMKKGSRIDVTVSSLGDAKSLVGGTLLMSPLQDTQGDIFAIAQGAVSTGSYKFVSDFRQNSRTKNHASVGSIPDGAIIQKEVTTNELSREVLKLELANPDFSSAVAVSNAINKNFGTNIAQTADAATIDVNVPANFKNGGKFFEFISKVENTRFIPEQKARVVLNEKTGTIVAGGNVTISEIAVTHGGITVEVKKSQLISQPPPLTLGNTEIVNSTEQKIEEKKPQMVVLGPTTNVSELAIALNKLGVTSRDVIAIFQAIKQAGALQAELIVI